MFKNAKRTYNECYITHIHPLSERHNPTPFTVFICIRSSSANSFLSRVTKHRDYVMQKIILRIP